MAAFTTGDPGDRSAFDAHMARVRSSPDITLRAVTGDGRLVGSIASFVFRDQTEVTYWIDRAAWGGASLPGRWRCSSIWRIGLFCMRCRGACRGTGLSGKPAMRIRADPGGGRSARRHGVSELAGWAGRARSMASCR